MEDLAGLLRGAVRLSLTKSRKRAMFSRRAAAGVSEPRTPTPCRAVSMTWALDRALATIAWYQTSSTT
jgi:hypothetical protein